MTYNKLRVAPQSSSPAITSSIESGVAIIASKTLLVIHPDIGPVRALEECRVHYRDSKDCGCDEVYIGDTVDLLDIGTNAKTDCKQVQERLDQWREKVHLPGPEKDHEVPVPDLPGPPRDSGYLTRIAA